jgi:hypothetical protein
VEIDLPMPVRRIVADRNVQSDQGRVALQRGPIVYCLEWPDNQGQVRNLILPDEERLASHFEPALLSGVEVVQGNASSLTTSSSNTVVRAIKPFTAIPYYAWANRGRGGMTVWIPNSEKSAQVQPQPSIASASRITLSHPGTNPEAINDQLAPNPSPDQTNVFFASNAAPFFHWWPRKGTPEWVQYDFAKPARVSAVEVYWFDDTGHGECRVPQSWHFSYRTSGEWKRVENPGAYGGEIN